MKTMNFTEISEKYPKAYKKVHDWALQFDTGNPHYNSTTDYIDTRDLYDFFDSEGIIVEIRYFSLEKSRI